MLGLVWLGLFSCVIKKIKKKNGRSKSNWAEQGSWGRQLELANYAEYSLV